MVRWGKITDMVGFGGLKEAITLSRILEGKSLARFGDGELNLVHGEDARLQVYSDDIRDELRYILSGQSPCLVGIPHVLGKRPNYWKEFLSEHSSHLNPRHQYVSSFISRPDECDVPPLPHIWKSRDVLLISGGGSFSRDHFSGAKSVDVIAAPARDAYTFIDYIENKVPADADLVILCLGPTATCLAHRLCVKGIQALDLGFSGAFIDGKAPSYAWTEDTWQKQG